MNACIPLGWDRSDAFSRMGLLCWLLPVFAGKAQRRRACSCVDSLFLCRPWIGASQVRGSAWE